MSQQKVRHVLLTGSPGMYHYCSVNSLVSTFALFNSARVFLGVGKTTLTKKICKALQERNVPVVGFYTEEVREGGRRIGFDIIDIAKGIRKPLARV
jgi:hypothetical protein